MTPAEIPAQLQREMGCTPAELLGWLPAAFPGARLTIDACAGVARAAFDDGSLSLRWREAAPRRIALMRIPRLHVHFEFQGLDAARRQAVLHRFDLATQRGGG